MKILATPVEKKGDMTHAGCSSITTDIDFEKEGKQASFLKVPYSRNTSAWGAIHIPLIVIKNGRGPTLLFVGGCHGGEHEGPVALMKMCRELRPEQVQGRVIFLPALNLPAVQVGQRVSPLDGLDMNRVFPGQHNGTVTRVIAHYVHSVLLPLCDVVVDLHAGGVSLNLLPYISMHYLEDSVLMSKTYAALKAFQAPMSLIINEISGEGLLDYEVEKMGKIFLCAELGGMGTFSPYGVRIAERGVCNLLVHFGVTEGTITPQQPETRFMEVPSPKNYCTALAEGVYESFLELGEVAALGQQVGQIHFPEDPMQPPKPVLADASGVLIGTRGPGNVERGDCVALIAQEKH